MQGAKAYTTDSIRILGIFRGLDSLGVTEGCQSRYHADL